MRVLEPALDVCRYRTRCLVGARELGVGERSPSVVCRLSAVVHLACHVKCGEEAGAGHSSPAEPVYKSQGGYGGC